MREDRKQLVGLLTEDPNIVLEEGTNESIVQFEFRLEDDTGVMYQEDGTTGSGLGDILQAEDALSQVSLDTYGTSNDLFLLETETFADLDPSVPAEKYSIRKVFLKNGANIMFGSQKHKELAKVLKVAKQQ